MTTKKQSFSLSVILGSIIVILAALLVYQYFYGTATLKAISKDELSKRIVENIGKQVGDEKNVSIDSIEKEGSLYKISINVLGQNYESYATLDGKYLFPQKVDIIPIKPQEITKTEKPEVKLFVMSYCPFGNQAEELLAPVNGLLKDKADVKLHYIIYSNYSSGYPDYCIDKENKYCSMHGTQEVNQDIRELCVQKYQKDKLWDFIKEINDKTTSENADKKWEAIAQELGIDSDKIKQCQKEEGISLLEQELALTKKDYPVQDPSNHGGKKTQTISGSPTLVINGFIYDGARSTSAYQEAICGAFLEAPEQCSQQLDEEQVAPPGGSCE